jgi:hypothetical protein
MTQFQIDLARGKVAEQFVANLFTDAKVEFPPEGYFPDYDLKIDGRPVEVKHDLLASRTGNFALELPALWHSKAQWLAIVTDNPRTVYFAPLQEALRLAQEWPRKQIVGEGVEAALVPIKVFIERLNPRIVTTN